MVSFTFGEIVAIIWGVGLFISLIIVFITDGEDEGIYPFGVWVVSSVVAPFAIYFGLPLALVFVMACAGLLIAIGIVVIYYKDELFAMPSPSPFMEVKNNLGNLENEYLSKYRTTYSPKDFEHRYSGMGSAINREMTDLLSYSEYSKLRRKIDSHPGKKNIMESYEKLQLDKEARHFADMNITRREPRFNLAAELYGKGYSDEEVERRLKLR
jgi:glycosyltransferase involved in cell wall biosynthesis